MNNFNKEQKCYCQYCRKECKNLNSLRQHEIRCKENPNKIKCIGQHKTRKGLLNNYKWIHYKEKQLFLPINKISIFLENGWEYGMNNKSKQHIKKSHIGNSLGKCKDPLKELERKQKISNSMKGNTNWKYNKHHGNAKQGWYHGIHCDSTWELAFLVYYIEHNLFIERCKDSYDFIWENEHHKYIPDFITDEGIIEIKGRKTKKSLEKEKQFPNIKVIDSSLIIPYLQYVISKYGNDFWKQLYENK